MKFQLHFISIWNTIQEGFRAYINIQENRDISFEVDRDFHVKN